MPKEKAKKRREDFDRGKFISGNAEGIYASQMLFKNLIPERGFHNPGGRTEGIIVERNWPLFTKHPSSAVVPLVREFYANASEERNDSVYVRGKWVRFDSTTINNLYGLDDILIDDYSIFANSAIDYNRIILFLCGGNARVSWKKKDSVVVNFPASGLTSASKAWHYFISARLLPSGNVSEVTRDRAVLNYCIQTDLSINIGRIIHRSIRNILKAQLSVGLGHPSLIHELCVTQGVVILQSEEFTSPKTAITKQKISSYSSKITSEYDEGSSHGKSPSPSSAKSLSISERMGRLEGKAKELDDTMKEHNKWHESVDLKLTHFEKQQMQHYTYVSDYNSAMSQMFENCSLNIGPRRVDFPEPPIYQQYHDEEEEEQDEEEEEED